MRALVALTLGTLLLAGCGRAPLAAAPAAKRAGMQARSDAGLRDGVVALRKLRFARLDTSKDGRITPDEATDKALAVPGIVQGFAGYDADGDGAIVLGEFLRDDVIAFWAENLRHEIQKLFLKQDANGDFKLTGKEREKATLFFSTHPQLKGGDLDGDGAVTYTEFEDAYMVVLPMYQPPLPSEVPSP